MRFVHYTSRVNIPPAPWPDSVKAREVVKHTLGVKAFDRYLVVTWCWF